jgi:hypothetical protein
VKGGVMNIARGGAGFLSSKTGKAGAVGNILQSVL